MSDLDDSDFQYANLDESDIEDSEESDVSSDISSDEDDEPSVWRRVNVDQPDVPPLRFPFTGKAGCTFDLEDDHEVLQYFRLFIDDELLYLLIVEINNYAEQQPSTASRRWKLVSRNEIMIYLTINIIQGILKLPVEKMYWTTSDIFSTPIFPKLMTSKRYFEIKKKFHFYNNAEYNPELHPNPKLHKIWPVFQHLNKKFSTLYIPEEDVTIDESLMLYKGRLGWVQYIPLKRARFGIKLYMLCESKSGYLFSCLIYTGKGTVISEKFKSLPITCQVVLSLMDLLLDKGYCLTTDNFYTSPELSTILIEHVTDSYGTLRINRKGLPPLLKTEKLKKGEIVAFQKEKTMVMKWKDKRDICLLSTVHNTETIATHKKDADGNEIFKLKLVVDYNHTMGGVDRLDQHIQHYEITRKRGKKYYKKIFFHFLDIALWNSFVLYKKKGRKMDNLQYRKSLIEKLISNYHSDQDLRKQGRPPKKPGSLRLTERHFPEIIPPTDKKQAPTRQCAVCCKSDEKGKKIRRESRYYCDPCKVGLCVAPCFRIFHTKEKF